MDGLWVSVYDPGHKCHFMCCFRQDLSGNSVKDCEAQELCSLTTLKFI